MISQEHLPPSDKERWTRLDQREHVEASSRSNPVIVDCCCRVAMSVAQGDPTSKEYGLKMTVGGVRGRKEAATAIWHESRMPHWGSKIKQRGVDALGKIMELEENKKKGCQIERGGGGEK